MRVLGQEVPAHVVESAERWMADHGRAFSVGLLAGFVRRRWTELQGTRAIRRNRLTLTFTRRLTQKHRKLGNLKCEGRVWSWVGGS